MRVFLILMFFITIPLSGDDSKWIRDAAERVDPETINWVRELLSQQTDKKNKDLNYLEKLSQGKCRFNSEIVRDQDFELFVCLSFSVPDETWLSLSKELEKIKGTIVIQGLPQNSFKEFYKKIRLLDKKGFTANLQINPVLFEKYQVSEVPSFITIKSNGFDKVRGNITLDYALQLFSQDSETKNVGIKP